MVNKNNIKDYIESGIIESYVLGLTNTEETIELEELAIHHNEVREAINAFSKSIEAQVLDSAVEPGPTIRPMVLATFDYLSRIEKGETPAVPPLLHEGSTINDYAKWLNRPDMVLPPEAEEIHAKIIGFTPEATTIIVWIENGAPGEVHTDEHEKFLIVEGSCDIIIEDEVHSLVAGSFLAIPLYKTHSVRVTSDIWCKVILQRAAA